MAGGGNKTRQAHKKDMRRCGADPFAILRENVEKRFSHDFPGDLFPAHVICSRLYPALQFLDFFFADIRNARQGILNRMNIPCLRGKINRFFRSSDSAGRPIRFLPQTFVLLVLLDHLSGRVLDTGNFHFCILLLPDLYHYYRLYPKKL